MGEVIKLGRTKKRTTKRAPPKRGPVGPAKIDWKGPHEGNWFGNAEDDPRFTVELLLVRGMPSYMLRIRFRHESGELSWPTPPAWPAADAGCTMFCEYGSLKLAKEAAARIVGEWIAFNEGNGIK